MPRKLFLMELSRVFQPYSPPADEVELFELLPPRGEWGGGVTMPGLCSRGGVERGVC